MKRALLRGRPFPYQHLQHARTPGIMAHEHQFNRSALPYRQQPALSGEGFRFTVTVTCAACGAPETFETIKPLPTQVVSKKLSQRGWRLGARRSKDECPHCANARPQRSKEVRLQLAN